MAKRRQKIAKALRKEVDLPISLPENRYTAFLTKKRNIVPRYFINSWRELRKVTWPSRKESWQLVLAVVAFTAFFTILTAAGDYVFNQIIERVVL